ncbi:MAG: lipoate protein ligase C-terminal domain-containing protein [Thermoplasmata archaeon]|jgi:hypothetical protein|nr:lipoate--protein ligase family protein [Euryarchaeota archaeon]
MKIGIYEYKAKKGLIRATVSLFDDSIEVKITGDFLIFPEDMVWELENSLRGIKPEEELISRKVEEVLSNATMIGCTVDDFKKTIIGALREVVP